jgi:hypothetical protein
MPLDQQSNDTKINAPATAAVANVSLATKSDLLRYETRILTREFPTLEYSDPLYYATFSNATLFPGTRSFLAYCLAKNE